VTTYKAIRVANVVPAETVAIFGVGGLGHLALQYARIVGGITIGVDIEDSKRSLARATISPTCSPYTPPAGPG
jgi:propanol-preferring alcohol dehydrogenase